MLYCQGMSNDWKKSSLCISYRLVSPVMTTSWMIWTLFSRFGSIISMNGISIWLRMWQIHLLNWPAFSGVTESLVPSSTAQSRLQGWTTTHTEDLYTAALFSMVTWGCQQQSLVRTFIIFITYFSLCMSGRSADILSQSWPSWCRRGSPW